VHIFNYYSSKLAAPQKAIIQITEDYNQVIRLWII